MNKEQTTYYLMILMTIINLFIVIRYRSNIIMHYYIILSTGIAFLIYNAYHKMHKDRKKQQIIDECEKVKGQWGF